MSLGQGELDLTGIQQKSVRSSGRLMAVFSVAAIIGATLTALLLA